MQKTLESIKIYKKTLFASLKYSFHIAPKEALITFLIVIVGAGLPYLINYLYGLLVNEITLVVNNPVKVGASIFIIFAIYSIVDSIPDLLGAIRSYFNRTFSLKFQSFMELEVLKKREVVDIAHYEDPKFQDLYQRAFQQSFWPLLNFTQDQPNLIKAIFSVILGSVLAVYFNPLVYIVIFLCALPKFIVEYKYSTNMYTIWHKDSPEQRRFADLRYHFTNRYNLVETKLLQTRKYLLSWIENIIINFNNKQVRAEKTKLTGLLFTEILASGGFIFGAYMILKDVLAGKILLGSMIYFIGVLSVIKNNFSQVLSNIANQGNRYLVVNDLLTFFETKPLIEISSNPIKLNLDSPPEIIFENVGFKYPKKDNYVIKNLNLKINPSLKFGLVGNNGAGKTTIVKLLCRIYDPTEGRILINGVDLKDVDLKEWWSYMSVMFQDYSSYDFSVREAIAVGRVDKKINDELVLKSAQVSQANEFIDKLEDKYNHQIGVEFGGIEPSKGQRQKLAIAKTLYRSGFLMILDEPTASVDAESESKIFKSLNDLSDKMTSILISHDFSMIKECDHIFVMKDGELFEEGNHATLMKKKGLYAELFNIQKEGFK